MWTKWTLSSECGQSGHCPVSDLSDEMLPPEARQPLVPDGGQQLLHAGMGHEGLLLVVDGELESGEGLDVPYLEQEKQEEGALPARSPRQGCG